MDVFKLGFRNLIGILIPGTIPIFAFLYMLFVIDLSICNINYELFTSNKTSSLILIILVICSYITGSAMRMIAADRVDDASSAYHCNAFEKREKCRYDWNQIMDIIDEIMEGSNITESENKLKGKWGHVWRIEKFPYPVWQLRKFDLFHPKDFYIFFRNRLKYMETKQRKNAVKDENNTDNFILRFLGTFLPLKSRNKINREARKEFFNYCKMMVYKSSNELGEHVIEEVKSAEAHARFYAGTYYGLFFSFILFSSLTIALFFKPFIMILINKQYNWLNQHYIEGVILTIFILIALILLMRTLMINFRRIRMKEVETVFVAYYQSEVDNIQLLCKVDDSRDKTSEYRLATENLLKDVFKKSSGQGKGQMFVSLESLATLMKERSKSKAGKYLSSIYFAGNEVDHPFFLKTDKFAAGISVLPEDAEKTEKRKRHPRQKEVVFVLEGSILLEVEGDQKELTKGTIHEIKEGQCHKISPVETGRKDAMFLFIKTNPAIEPREEDC